MNEDINYFYLGSKGYYCRKCIKFKRLLIEDDIYNDSGIEIKDNAYEYLLKYPLTKLQMKISKQCLENIDKSDVLIEAVCGAGKTEIVIETIAKFLKEKKKVCFAIPRRQVVLELSKRLQEIFSKSKVVAVCMGSNSEIYGDLIVCTTHQCYRYYNMFDCLILDESDAFPYKNNEVLKNIVKTSCKGNIIYLTATIDDYLKNRIKEKSIVHLKLNKRPHGHDLIVPRVILSFKFILIIYLLLYIRNNKKVLIFVPSIKLCNIFYVFLSLFYKVNKCHSKLKSNNKVIEEFKNGYYDCLVSTSILERGVTIENINVCVLFANNNIFDLAALIQMSGRVGRSFKYPKGDCLFLTSSKSLNVDNCINICKKANRCNYE